MTNREYYQTVADALPFLGIGMLGALVRSLNISPFSIKETLIRLVTASFACSITLLYLSTTTYPTAVQGAICGIVGALGIDLIDAVRIRMFKDITGEPPKDEDK